MPPFLLRIFFYRIIDLKQIPRKIICDSPGTDTERNGRNARMHWQMNSAAGSAAIGTKK